jgi:hypothetical protein
MKLPLRNRYIDTGGIFVSQLMTPVTIGRLSELYRRPQEPFDEQMAELEARHLNVRETFTTDSHFLGTGARNQDIEHLCTALRIEQITSQMQAQ